MAQVRIIYWHNFPSQVQAKDDNNIIRLPLPERFQQAIDAGAMKADVVGSDAYLDGWQQSAWAEHPSTAQEAAQRLHQQILNDYPPTRLAEMVHTINLKD